MTDQTLTSTELADLKAEYHRLSLLIYQHRVLAQGAESEWRRGYAAAQADSLLEQRKAFVCASGYTPGEDECLFATDTATEWRTYSQRSQRTRA